MRWGCFDQYKSKKKKGHTAFSERLVFKKGRSSYVADEKSLFISNINISKKYNRKLSKNHWSGKNFNKRGWK